MHLPYNLKAILILSVDIGTDVLPALALGVDPAEKGIMNRPPRNPKKKIMDLAFVGRFWYVGLFIGSITIGAYLWALTSQGWFWGDSLDADSAIHIKSSTVAFATLVLIQMINAYNSRSSHQSVFRMGLFSNLFLLGAIMISLGVVYILVEVPFFQEWIHTANLEWYEWMIIIVSSFGVLVVEEVRKGIVRWRMKRVSS
jgi:magnesium-transporting ATPase (P-type)